MASYTATVLWKRSGDAFTDNRYSRAHSWHFDGGVRVPASASPHVVPTPMSDPAAVDPEEAFVAALSSCHMLFFLSLAAQRGFIVERYEDEAIGKLEHGDDGRPAMTEVRLQPRVKFAGDVPDQHTFEELHEESHEQCFIANSVRTKVRVEASVDETDEPQPQRGNA